METPKIVLSVFAFCMLALVGFYLDNPTTPVQYLIVTLTIILLVAIGFGMLDQLAKDDMEKARIGYYN